MDVTFIFDLINYECSRHIIAYKTLLQRTFTKDLLHVKPILQILTQITIICIENNDVIRNAIAATIKPCQFCLHNVCPYDVLANKVTMLYIIKRTPLET